MFRKKKETPPCPFKVHVTEFLTFDRLYLPTSIKYRYADPHTWSVFGVMTVHLPKDSIMLGVPEHTIDRYGCVQTFIISYQHEGATHQRLIENGEDFVKEVDGARLICHIFINHLEVIVDS